MKKIIMGFLSLFSTLFGYGKDQLQYEITIRTDIKDGVIVLREVKGLFKNDLSFTTKENILHESELKNGIVILKGKTILKRFVALDIRTPTSSITYPMYLESGNINIEIKLQRDKSFVSKGTITQEDFSISMLDLISIENKILEDENFIKNEANAIQIKNVIDNIGLRDKKGDFYYFAMISVIRMVDIKAHKEWFKKALTGKPKTDMQKIFAYTLQTAMLQTESKEISDTIDTNTEIVKSANFVDIEGKTKNILQFGKDKIILIDFWASWCAPCMSNIKNLKELQAKYGDKLVIVGISTDKDEDKWKNAIKKHDINWVQLRDDKNIIDLLKIKSIPYFMVCNKDGKVVYAGNSSLSNVDNVISSW